MIVTFDRSVTLWSMKEALCSSYAILGSNSGIRFIVIGTSNRPLYTEDPSKGTLLPSSEIGWDDVRERYRGWSSTVRCWFVFLLGDCAPRTSLALFHGFRSNVSQSSPFARLGQAANLLGRVIIHCNDPTPDISMLSTTPSFYLAH